MLIYSMREEADSILYSFGLSDDNDRKKYQTNPRLTLLSVSYLRTKKFNMRRQEEGETVDSFITSPALPASKTLQLSYTMK